MLDINKLPKKKQLWWESKTMKVLQNLKKWKVWDITLKDIKKFDSEYQKIKELSNDFKDNKISKTEFESNINVLEKFVTWYINNAFITKYWDKPKVNIHINRLNTKSESKYEFAIWNPWEDARFEEYQSIDKVIEKMKYLES
jgi:hypothetical protein